MAGKYSIILMDPPWNYSDKLLCGNRGASCKYPVLKQKDLKVLPVGDLAAEDCVLFLWVTMPLLQEGLDLIQAYGFKYNTCAFNWVKWNKVQNSPFWGMGHSTRANAELCLLAKRGRLKRRSASVSQVMVAPVRKHSSKPSEIRDKIVELYGDLPRIELFARDKVDGWDALGLDLDGEYIQDALPELLK